jgi:hypothetical protein
MVRLRGFPRVSIKYEVPALKERKLRHKVEIYVPAKTETQRLIAHLVFKRFCEFFGGATVTVAKGGLINSDGALIEDEIAIVRSFVKSIDGSVRKLVRKQAHDVQLALDQDAVTVVLDNTCAFIEREDSEVPYKAYEEMNYTIRR